MRRGEVYRVFTGADPKQYRTFVVVSRQALIESRFSTVICAPVYSEGQGLLTQVSVGVEEGLRHESWIMCDNLASLRKSDLTQYLGSLSSRKMLELDRSLAAALELA